ncbi:Serine/threonine-protein kinase MRCK gamma [Trichinella spiralis]|uniref:Serine/threonine-protein kinase MRCK gamma n=1 Tax=Trichinella spiralis TaxID=6334 RepID=A0ABR3KQ71_TRISP
MAKGKNDSVGNKTIGRPGGKSDDQQLCFAKGNQERKSKNQQNARHQLAASTANDGPTNVCCLMSSFDEAS